jgi:hypothetical protein
MLWHTSSTPQRHAPRGEVTTACAGQSGYPTEAEQNGNRKRWRS